jgi:hypothetical protein
MSVQPIEVHRAAPVAEWSRHSARSPVAAQQGPRDQAVLSSESQILAARLAKAEEAIKLHLSPKELRELVTPPEA